MVETTLTINTKDGLHGRPAARFVQTAARFKSSIRIRNLAREGSKEIDAKSIIAMMQLGAKKGHQILVRAEGDDEQVAIIALQQLSDSNFGEAP